MHLMVIKKKLNSVHDVYLYYISLLNEKRKSDTLLNELNMLCMIQLFRLHKNAVLGLCNFTFIDSS